MNKVLIGDLPKKTRMKLLKERLPKFNANIFNKEYLKSLQHCATYNENKLEDFLHPVKFIVDKYNVDLSFEENTKKKYHEGSYFYTKNKIELYFDPKKVVFLDDIILTICHELAHHIQHQLYGMYCRQLRDYNKKLSVNLEFEYEACRLAYFIYQSHFKYMTETPFQPHWFREYRTQFSKHFLLHYKNLEQDVAIFRNERIFPKEI